VRGVKGALQVAQLGGKLPALKYDAVRTQIGYSTRSDFPNWVSSVTAKAPLSLFQRGAVPWMGGWKPSQGPGAFRGELKHAGIHMQGLLQ